MKADGSPVDSDPDTLHLIETAIFSALTATSISTNQQRITRTLRSFLSPTEVTFIEDKGRNLTIMEVSSPDRPGLLAQIGQILDGSNIAIQAAKIQTLGERVEDVFFLTNTDGNRLDDEATCEHLRMALCEALDKDVAA